EFQKAGAAVGYDLGNKGDKFGNVFLRVDKHGKVLEIMIADLFDARTMPRIASLSWTTCCVTTVRSCCQASHMVLTAEPGSSKVMVAMPSTREY
ncbi:MAG: hypothetical protein ABJA49_17155, partial [Betaproteobacteria bacterium]